MGTTLTGTTPQDTYDSLIKVTDNGPLSGSLKTLTDGLGNDSALALSTGAASVTGTLAVSSSVTAATATLTSPNVFLTNNAATTSEKQIIIANTGGSTRVGIESSVGGAIQIGTEPYAAVFGNQSNNPTQFTTNGTARMTISSAGSVGIGTSGPSAELQVNKASDVTLALSNSTAVTSGNRGSLSFYNSDVSTVALIKATAVTDNVGTQLEFYTRPAAGSLAQTMTIASTGNVGIGTSSPDTLLTLGSTASADNSAGIKIFRGDGTASYATYGFSGNAVINSVGGDLVIQRESSERARFTTAGLCFNGDFAAANALDDYEEGTFTPTIQNATLTGGNLRGSYTKIGRQVYVTVQFVNGTISGSSGGAYITNLPFAANALHYGVVSLTYGSAFSGATSGYINVTNAHMVFTQDTGTADAVWLDGTDNRSIMVNAVYQV